LSSTPSMDTRLLPWHRSKLLGGFSKEAADQVVISREPKDVSNMISLELEVYKRL
jgi:hypothetical protein